VIWVSREGEREGGREGGRTYRAVLHDDVALLGGAFNDVVVEADDEGVAQVLEDVHLRGREGGREGGVGEEGACM